MTSISSAAAGTTGYEPGESTASRGRSRSRWWIGSLLGMTVTGFVVGGFLVSRDDVRIEGDDEEGCPATTASVSGTITFRGAQRGMVACLTVTGEGNGVEAISAASVWIMDSSVSGNTEAGVFASSGSDIGFSIPCRAGRPGWS